MDFAKSMTIWGNVLRNPNRDTFLPQDESADIGTAFIWIALAAIVAGLLGAVGSFVTNFTMGMLFSGNTPLIEQLARDADLPPELVNQFAFSGSSALINAGIAFGVQVLFVPLGFFIGTILYFIGAKIFSGDGGFEAQTYALATFQAPILIINSIANLIPLLGLCITLPLSIYQLIVTYEAMKAVHNLTPPAALGAIIVPIVLVIVCICGPIIGLVVLLLSAGVLAA